jgi:hypothetical protein
MKWLAIVSIFVVILGSFTFLAVPKGRWKVLAVLTFTALTVTLFPGAFELLGHAKPIAWEWHKLKGSRIYGYVLVENRAIYLWLDRNGEPVAYVLPWSITDAQEVQDAIEGAGRLGGAAVMGPQIDAVPDAPDGGEIAKIVPPLPLEPKS